MSRLVCLCVALMACDQAVIDDVSSSTPPPVVVDPDADWGDELQAQRYVRASHLVFDGGLLDLSFNDSGVILAEELPPGASTPWIPLPTDAVSAQLLDPQTGEVVYDSGVLDVPAGGFATVGSFGVDVIAAPLAVFDDPRSNAGEVKYRIMHVVPGMPAFSVNPIVGGIRGEIKYGEWTSYRTFKADSPQKVVIDLNVAGVRLPYETFQLPDTDSRGFSQVINIYLIPSGAFLPRPINAPVPAMLIQPMDSPEGIVVIAPDI